MTNEEFETLKTLLFKFRDGYLRTTSHEYRMVNRVMEFIVEEEKTLLD